MGSLKNIIMNIPIPLCGLALGMASLYGFLWSNYDFYEFNVFAIMSAILVILFSMKVLINFQGFKKISKVPFFLGASNVFHDNNAAVGSNP